MNISKAPEMSVAIRINAMSSRTRAILSITNSVDSLILIRGKICFWSLLLLVFLVHRHSGNRPRKYCRPFSKSIALPCFTEISKGFAKIVRLTLTIIFDNCLLYHRIEIFCHILQHCIGMTEIAQKIL